MAVACGDGDGLAVLQFLLHGAALHLHDRRSAQCRSLRVLHADFGPRFQCRRAGADTGGCRGDARAHDGIALCLQPQAGRRRHARRPVVGDRLPDRADAEGARRAAARRERLDRGEGRLSAGRCARRGRHRRRQMGLAERSLRRPRLGYAARRQAPVPADAHRPRRDRRRRHRQRQAGAAADARRAPPARCADRPGRARDRAGAAGRGHGARSSARSRPSGCGRRC